MPHKRSRKSKRSKRFGPFKKKGSKTPKYVPASVISWPASNPHSKMASYTVPHYAIPKNKAELAQIHAMMKKSGFGRR